MELRHKFDLNILLSQTNMARSNLSSKKRLNQSKYQVIKELNQFNTKGRYGYRRITDELNNQGMVINHKTVLRLMKLLLKSLIRLKKYKSYKGEKGKIAPNILKIFFQLHQIKKWQPI
jgi:hypothetical protein